VSTPPPDDERFEHIPWEQIAPAGNRNRLIIYALAGAVLIAGLTASIVRGGSDGGTVAELVATPTTASPTPAANMTTTTLSPAPASTGSSTTAVDPVEGDTEPWSEADLMAFPSERIASEAAAVAEWLASDFFTVDGGTEIPRDLVDALPEGSPLPVGLPGSHSFVEWARAISVEEPTPGSFDVLVVVRRLGAAEGENYQRMPPIAVLIRLAWTEEGWSVGDLPALADSPLLVQAPSWSENEVPTEVAAAVTASTGGEVVAGVTVGDVWRLVVQMEDSTGVTWPIVIWTDAIGTRIPTPASPVQP
jgi:hypothetical protein